MNNIPITKEGYETLEKEFKHLKTEKRPEVISQIAEAREHGDLKENAEYHAARDKQSFIEGRISELESIVARAEVIDTSKLSGSTVKFGAKVELADDNTDEEFTYRIVGEYEAKIEDGLISITSPIARGLIGKEEGDIVNIKTPSGTKSYEILSVSFC